MNIEEALSYIHKTKWLGTKPGLSRTRRLLGALGDPQKSLKFVHVAGTNGKGSTCAMIASILRESGFCVGLYTSPYLIDFNERIEVDGTMISNDELCEVTEYVRPLADSLADKPTEFELITAIGFEYFARRACDIVVCEVGMGGEFDATNVIPAPEAAIICNIGLDHTAFLGDTREKIAATKSGIIKPGCDAVLYRSTPSVERVVEERCEKVGARLHKADFDSIKPISADLFGQVFDWESFKELKLPLLGEHQLDNAAVVLTAAEVLRAKGWAITEANIREGLRDVVWHGRFEIVSRDPLFIVDGGHNPQCIEALGQNIRQYLAGQPLTVLTGVLADKDYHCMYSDIAQFAARFVTVTPPNPRALDAQALAEYLAQFGKPVTACSSVDAGVREAIRQAGADGVVLAYGSLYMVGDIEAAVAETVKK